MIGFHTAVSLQQRTALAALPRVLPTLLSRSRVLARSLTAQAEKGGKDKKVIVVGGVAGGASAAARLRRLTEAAEITIYEKGPFVSFANCGLPYFIGGVIEVRNVDALLAFLESAAVQAAAH